MKIGDFTASAIVTSRFALDGGAMFGVVPKTLWAKKVRVDALNRIDMVTRSLLLKSEERKILIDTGNGDKWTRKLKEIYRIEDEGTNLVAQLRSHDMTPEDITDVICTHLHFDHVGGNTRFDSDGKLAPTFPNATYWIQRAQWEHANSPSERDRASYMEENWRVLQDNDQIKLLDGEEELFPGISVIVVHGHTPGQQLPVVSDGTDTLLFGGDLFPMAPHIPLPWVMAYDLAPLTTIEEKKNLLPKIVEGNWILFLEHDPDTATCRVEKTDRGFRNANFLLCP